MKFIHLFRCNISYVASNQMWRIMRLIIVIMTAFLMQVSASTFGQQLTIKNDRITLRAIFSQIRKQTGYNVLATSSLVNKARPVSLDLDRVPLEDALKKILAGQHLDYTIKNKAIFISEQEEPSFLEKMVDAFTPPIDVSGVVLDEKGMPLPGANIKVKGFKQSTVTDNDGKFYLSGVDDKAVLVVSFVGYKDVEVGAKTSLSVALDLKSAELEEVVVAYGKTTLQALTGAMTVVKGDDIRDLPALSIDKNLQGYVPGLLVTSGSGQPGSGLSNFVLRGIATSGSSLGGSTIRNPLIVIDGIPVSQDSQQIRIDNLTSDVPISNPMAQINPSDIESISVLKDASAIALYGSKASNGVILIVTKMGKAGKTQFNFRNNTSILQRLKGKIEPLNQEEYMELVFETYKNTDPSLSDEAITNQLKGIFPTRSDGTFYPFKDLTDLVYTNKAITTTNEISMSGGNERSSFYSSLEWTKNNGTYRKTGYDRKSIRYNFDNKVRDWLKVGMNNSMSYNLQDYTTIETQATFFGINVGAPLNPIYLENGDYFLNYTIPYDTPNPIAVMEYNSSRNTSYRALSNLSTEVSFLKYFKFSSIFGLNFQLTEAKERRDPRLFDPEARDLNIGSGRIYEGAIRELDLITTNKLSFARPFGSHSFNVLIAQEAQTQMQKNVTATGVGLQFLTNDEINNTSVRSSSGGTSKKNLLSYFGQINYDYLKRYFVSTTIRLDADSKFGSGERFGTYWSAGAGWIISEEPIMRSMKQWLNYLKIRGSVGSSGNSGVIDKHTKYTRLSFSNYLNTSTIAVYPGANSQPYNPDVRWEETFSSDIGLEARLWNNRIGLTADLYRRKTEDLLYIIDIPLVSGYRSVLSNIGDMLNQGIEISLSADIVKFKNFAWNINANWSTNKNKLIRANVKFVQSGFMANEEGKNYNSYYFPVWAGADPETGAGTWIDLSGKPTTDYSAAKLQFVGKPQPDGFGAITHTISFRNIQLSAQFYYQYGNKIYVEATPYINDGYYVFSNQSKEALDRWQKPGDIAPNPKRMLNNSLSLQPSTRYLYDGDYIRLQNISLSYRLPDNFIKLLHLNGLSINASAYNVALWTKSHGSDIADANVSGVTGNGYPNSSSYSLGVNLTF